MAVVKFVVGLRIWPEIVLIKAAELLMPLELLIKPVSYLSASSVHLNLLFDMAFEETYRKFCDGQYVNLSVLSLKEACRADDSSLAIWR